MWDADRWNHPWIETDVHNDEILSFVDINGHVVAPPPCAVGFCWCHSAQDATISGAHLLQAAHGHAHFHSMSVRPRVPLANVALYDLDFGNVPSWDLAAPSSTI